MKNKTIGKTILVFSFMKQMVSEYLNHEDLSLWENVFFDVLLLK